MAKPLRSSRSYLSGCLFAALWTSISLIILVAMVAGGLDSAFEDGRLRLDLLVAAVPLPALLLIGTIILIGVVIGVFSVRPLLAGIRVGTPELRLDVEHPVVGQRLNMYYRQSFRGNVTVTAHTIQLIFKESATYTQGTDRHTDTHSAVMDEVTLNPGRYHGRSAIRQELELEIPRDSMHTFEAANNKLEWFIRLEIDLAGWPVYWREYELPVRAELAQR
ncbi:MAG: hypothetical protein R3300_07440 [Candidatus Promineifilaceae bacterium]|nr:hypothetical protein [Candidatus Promineifilaceae bacterium]